MDTVQYTNGKTEAVPTHPPDWWFVDEGSGRIRPTLLALDSEQPRKHMEPGALLELKESVVSVGVREPITVTPISMTPWASIDETDQDLPFLVVSGHRRTTVALDAQLESVPIRVRIYKNAQEHELDRSLLNKNRADLTELEEGFEIIRLKDKGLTLDALSKAFGCSVAQLYNRIHLTTLPESLQKLLDPSLPAKRRLPTTVGAALGSTKVPTKNELIQLHELFGEYTDQPLEEIEHIDDQGRRHHAQLLLYDVIQSRKLKSVRAVAFIKEHSLKLSASGRAQHRSKKREEPARKRELFETWLTSIGDSLIIDWRPEEWRRVFEYVPYEDLEEVLGRINEAEGLLEQIKKRLESIQSTKKPTSAAVKAAFGKN
jgi:ParB/RepB/Spo0J family partition protein